jgi:hypothetical protein
MFAACDNQQSFPERSVDEISHVGFYAYVLSDPYETEFHWRKTIKLWSFDKHCSGFFSEDTWNPIYITYTQGMTESFELRISPQDAIWDRSKDTKQIGIDASWIPNRQGEYYEADNGLRFIRIKDSLGMDVIVSSTLEINTLIRLIEHMEYVGPSYTTVINPWEAACKN